MFHNGSYKRVIVQLFDKTEQILSFCVMLYIQDSKEKLTSLCHLPDSVSISVLNLILALLHDFCICALLKRVKL